MDQGYHSLPKGKFFFIDSNVIFRVALCYFWIHLRIYKIIKSSDKMRFASIFYKSQTDGFTAVRPDKRTDGRTLSEMLGRSEKYNFFLKK